MRALAPDQAQRLGAITVDLDPEHVEVADGAQDFQIALGAGIEVEIEQQVDVGPGTLADRQTVRDVESLFGRPLRLGGAKIADQRIATQLMANGALVRLSTEN